MISVIIPTCHRNDLLATCLTRLAPGFQDFPATEYEVIVTDDGTKSTAQELVRQKFPWARWSAGPKRGPAANRNCGVRQASGEWMAFVDDDCVPSRQWLHEYASAIGDNTKVLEGMTTCEEGLSTPLDEAPFNLTGGHLWSCNFLIRTDIFKSLGGFNESFPTAAGEDTDFRIRVSRVPIPIDFIPGAKVDHPPRPRKRGVQAAQMWRSRLLLEALHGSWRREWLPLHILKVRIAQLIPFRFSAAWFPYLWSTLVEVTVTAVNYRRWKAESVARASQLCAKPAV